MKVRHISPQMQDGYLADLCNAAKEYNVCLLAYFSIGRDNQACKAKPLENARCSRQRRCGWPVDLLVLRYAILVIYAGSIA